MDFDSQNCQPIENKYNQKIPVKEWKKKNRVLIMQHSAVTNFNDRQQNRETWMQVLKVNRISNLILYLDLLKITQSKFKKVERIEFSLSAE